MTRKRSPDDPPYLSPEELERFCDYLYRQIGMTFGETKRYYVDRRVADRVTATEEAGFAAWFARLRADPDEREAVVNAFTVNETYFYREAHQLQCLSRDLLPEIAAGRGPGDRIRIWSNPCSTGEEAYSVAIWLLENWPMVDAYNVEIVGSDIDTAALEAARDADYGARALSRLPADVVHRYFEPLRHGRRRLIQDLRESVAFRPTNLVDADAIAAEGLFDVVFCRNVLIYFDDASRGTALSNLHRSVRPGGFLCLGHTESSPRTSELFVPRRFKDAIVYQRPAERG